MLANDDDSMHAVPDDFRLVEAGRALVPRIERGVAQLRAILRVQRAVHWEPTYVPLLLKLKQQRSAEPKNTARPGL